MKIRQLFRALESGSWWPLLCLRVVVGIGFVAHGVAKLTRGPDRFAEVLTALHVPAPSALAWVVIAIELAGGAAVAAGVFVRAAAVPLAAVLVVAAIEVHLPFGFSSIKLVSIGAAGPVFGSPGVETDLLYLASLAVVALHRSRRPRAGRVEPAGATCSDASE
jgi:putative oxidoreductase